MAYLIDQLVWWLLLAAFFAALAGWAFAAMRADPEEKRLRQERERLLREFVLLSGDDDEASPPSDLQLELMRQRTDVSSSRVIELEQALAAARDRADDNAGRIAELQRELENAEAKAVEAARLRVELEGLQTEHQHVLEAPAAPEPHEDAQLREWRLRYFERRVDYLESQPVQTLALPAPSPEPAPVEPDPLPLLQADWRARLAEAAADELLVMAREPRVVAPPQPSAEEIEAEQRRHWRMLYLERRAHYLQAALDEALTSAPEERAPAAPDAAAIEDEARRAWRRSYLERRVAYLRTHAAEAAAIQAEIEPEPEPFLAAAEVPEVAPPAPTPEPAPEPAPVIAEIKEEEPSPPPAPAPLVPRGMEERPSALPAARNGAPDDFTLIEGVSPMQQSTLNSLGIYHFDQIASWTPANIAWVDQYLRLRGRITEEEWVEQAQDLARGLGVARAERVTEDA